MNEHHLVGNLVGGAMMWTIDPRYHAAILHAALQQAVVLVLASLMLDFGQSFRASCVAALTHWVAIFLIVFRRPGKPTRLTLRSFGTDSG